MGKYTGILLCSDFDGTLYNGRFIPEDNMKAIKYFRENGGLFTIVSGRNSEFLIPFFEGYNFGVPIVNFNGAMFYDFDNRKVVSEHFMSGVTMEHMNRILHEVEGVCRLSFFQKSGLIREPKDKNSTVDPARLDKLYKFAVNISGSSSDWIVGRDKIAEIMKDHVAVRSYEDYVEVLEGEFTKAPSTRKLADMVGADTLVCVGDYENDIEMVKKADIGYAVANAIPELRAVADRVTVSVDDAAIAKIIEEL